MQLASYVKTRGARINAWRQVPILPTDEEALILTIIGGPVLQPNGQDLGPLNVTLELTPSDAVQVRKVLEDVLQKIAAGVPVDVDEAVQRG